MQCDYCSRPSSQPMCSRACDIAFAASNMRGRALIGIWAESCMWRLPDGRIDVRIDTADSYHTRILHTEASLRPGDAADLRQWLDAMDGADGRVHDADAVVRLRRALNAGHTPCHPSIADS